MIAVMAPALRQPGDVCVIVTGDHGFQRHMIRLVQQGCDVVLIYAGAAGKSFTEDANWRTSIPWVKLLDVRALKDDVKVKSCHAWYLTSFPRAAMSPL